MRFRIGLLCGALLLFLTFQTIVKAQTANTIIYSGFVFIDVDKDGVRDASESGYSGVTVRMTNSANSAVLNTTTNSTGSYTVQMNGTGTFCIAMPTVPNGYTATTTQGPTRCTTITGSGNTNTNSVNFGIASNIVTYTIIGSVFNDYNKNGVKEVDEPNYNGTPNVTASRGTVTNNSNGTYSIANLDAGTVIVSYTSLPAGYTMTYPLNGPPASFQVTVGPGCNTNGARGASCQ
jgi:hypothetical protein